MGTNILLVALGGAVGSVGRYLTVEALRRWSPDAAFPAGTFAVNTIGCFVMGIAFGYVAGTLALCLASVWGGHGVGKSIWSAS